MKLLGRFFRYILDINTVWAAMILISFAACLAQHYLPTRTSIPAQALHLGTNTITIHISTGEKDRVQKFLVEAEPRALKLAGADQSPARDHPWLIDVAPANGAFRLTWDDAGYGQYKVLCNDVEVGTGRLVTLQAMTDAAFDYAKKGFDIALGLIATMVLFLGLMKVGEDAGVVQLAARIFHPIIRLLFPDVPRDHPASGAILMNITTSILGLGNAATPFGLKAMKELQSLNPNPNVATNAQVMLLGYNTAGFALLPTTLLAVRKAAGCSDPFEIIGTCMITGAISTIAAIILARALANLPFFSIANAVREDEAETAAARATGGAA